MAALVHGLCSTALLKYHERLTKGRKGLFGLVVPEGLWESMTTVKVGHMFIHTQEAE